MSILGAGASGFALAIDLQARGIKTLLYSHPEHLQHALDMAAKGSHVNISIPRITTDIAQAVHFATFIALTVPSSGQETILEELRHFDLTAHTFVSIPGNLISLLAPKLKILETNLSPYSCRIKNGEVVVMGRKKLFYIAGPRDERIGLLFDVRWCSNILEVCLSNINGVFHPIMMILNAGRIGTDFLLYRDGLTRPVAKAMEQLDEVRLRIGEAFGFKLKSVIDISNECYGQTFTDLVDLARSSPPHNKLEAPYEIDHRNISEDVPDLLVCWHELAVKLGIDATCIQSTIVMAEMVTGRDYFRSGRNLERLGLGNLSKEQLIARFSVSQEVGSASIPSCDNDVMDVLIREPALDSPKHGLSHISTKEIVHV